MALKGLGPLPRRKGSALALGCDRGGSGALPLPRAAVISTGVLYSMLSSTRSAEPDVEIENWPG